MKRLISLSLVLSLLFVFGCVSFQGSDVIATITARRVGYRVGVRYPDIAKEAIGIANKVIETKTDKAINDLDVFIKEQIIEQVDDLILKADIKTLLSLIKIEADIPLTADKKEFIIGVVSDFKDGLDIALEK